jgi:ubiquinone/menaquinone biosynthesis C-methylase UbiE
LHFLASLPLNYSNIYAGQRVGLIGADLSFLPFSNETFDAFVSESTFHELQIGLDDALHSLMEIVRVLKSGGKLIIIDKLAADRKDLAEYQLELLERDINQELANRRLWGFHDIEDYISLFEKIGLENIRHKIFRPKSYRALTNSLDSKQMLISARSFYKSKMI